MNRHHADISRIEGFSDSVFAFAVTLLVVSLEVPKTFDQLLASLRGFGGFAVAFAILFVIWMEQNRFFRRYALRDSLTLWLNALLLFLVLLFVYPLKFLFTWLFQAWTGNAATTLRAGQERPLMLIYGAGYASVFVVFLLLYWRAYLKRGELQLSAGQIFDARSSMIAMGVQISIGAVSFVFALANQAAWAGLTYLAIGPALKVSGFLRGRRRRLFLAATEDGAE